MKVLARALAATSAFFLLPPALAHDVVCQKRFEVVDLRPATEGGWKGVNVYVKNSDRVEITIPRPGLYSWGKYCAEGCNTPLKGLATMPINVMDKNALHLPTANFGALIGRIGNGTAFVLGESGALISGMGNGQLQINMNDVKGAESDNEGTIGIEISVCGPG